MSSPLKVVTGSVARASVAAGGGAGTGPALEDSLGFLICDTARYVRRVLSSRLAPYGIPGSCWFVLRALWQRDGCTQRELSAMLGLAEPAVMMTLRTLERLGLVTRARDESDKRRIAILLTQRARDIEEELLGVAAEVNQAMLATISPDARASMMSSLRSVHTELERACDSTLQPFDKEIAGERMPSAARLAAQPEKKRVFR
ncbi:MAG: MarR family transcriptional regulator [Proteobacteria bacterium]|nr:MarR family transcriptional regulator [Pseudomonadota bacterium]